MPAALRCRMALLHWAAYFPRWVLPHWQAVRFPAGNLCHRLAACFPAGNLCHRLAAYPLLWVLPVGAWYLLWAVPRLSLAGCPPALPLAGLPLPAAGFGWSPLLAAGLPLPAAAIGWLLLAPALLPAGFPLLVPVLGYAPLAAVLCRAQFLLAAGCPWFPLGTGLRHLAAGRPLPLPLAGLHVLAAALLPVLLACCPSLFLLLHFRLAAPLLLHFRLAAPLLLHFQLAAAPLLHSGIHCHFSLPLHPALERPM